MQRSCAVCGTGFEAQRPQAKYCSAKCRMRKARGHESADKTADAEPAPKTDRPASGLIDAVTAELEAADRLNSVAGQHALELANRIVNAPGMNTGVAALSKQLQAVLAEAVKGASQQANPLDELRARRDRKRVAG